MPIPIHESQLAQRNGGRVQQAVHMDSTSDATRNPVKLWAWFSRSKTGKPVPYHPVFEWRPRGRRHWVGAAHQATMLSTYLPQVNTKLRR